MKHTFQSVRNVVVFFSKVVGPFLPVLYIEDHSTLLISVSVSALYAFICAFLCS